MTTPTPRSDACMATDDQGEAFDRLARECPQLETELAEAQAKNAELNAQIDEAMERWREQSNQTARLLEQKKRFEAAEAKVATLEKTLAEVTEDHFVGRGKVAELDALQKTVLRLMDEKLALEKERDALKETALERLATLCPSSKQVVALTDAIHLAAQLLESLEPVHLNWHLATGEIARNLRAAALNKEMGRIPAL